MCDRKHFDRILSLNYYLTVTCLMMPYSVFVRSFCRLIVGLGSWPNIDQTPAPELTIFKSMAPAPAPELVLRFMWSQLQLRLQLRLQLQSSFKGCTNVVKCNIFLAMDFTDNITIC